MPELPVASPKITSKRQESKMYNAVKKLGRPPKYLKRYAKDLMDYMAKGYSMEAFGGQIGASKKVLDTWTEKYKEFADAKERGFTMAYNYWEKQGRKKHVNIIGWIFTMKNKFNWKDKSDVTTADSKLPTPTIYIPKEDNRSK